MKIRNFYDKIGFGSIGLGVDGLFLHTDMSSWMDPVLPQLVLILLKSGLLLLGLYLIYLFGKQDAGTAKEQEEVSVILAKRKKRARLIRRNHWFILLTIVYLSIAMNWGNEKGSGGGIAILVTIGWLSIIWPVLHFWTRSYADPAKIIATRQLSERDHLIEELFRLAKKQNKKIVLILLGLILVVTIFSGIFPDLAGQSTSADGASAAFLFTSLITFGVWMEGLFRRRKVNKVRNYYISHPEAKCWAICEKESLLTLYVDDRTFDVSILFLPFSPEKCCAIINGTAVSTTTQEEELPATGDEQQEADQVTEEKNITLDPALHYQASGKAKYINYIILALLLAPLYFLCSFIYAYLIWFIPFPYFNFFFTLGFGVATGLILNIAVKYAKSRNRRFSFFTGTVVGLVAHYASWLFWLDLVLNQGETIAINHPRIPISSFTPSSTDLHQVIGLLLHPGTVWNMLSQLKTEGYFSLFGFQISGFVLLAVWVVEAGIVLFFASFFPYIRSKRPYCETNNRWYPEKEVRMHYVTQPLKTVQALNEGIPDFLQNRPDENGDADHSLFKLYFLEGQQAYLTIENKKMEISDKGKISYKDTEIVEYLKINESLAGQLQQGIAGKNTAA